ncbi:MAG: glycosyltransferase family 2 protein [Myxococcales bacterium]|nr:glycosyltransferase family 2 protein [Myxococcales bacterium]
MIAAFDAAATIQGVLRGLAEVFPEGVALIVVDDGSADRTALVAERAGAVVVRHGHHRGKGAALRTGMGEALGRGCEVAITVDADGRHPPIDARRLHDASDDPDALVLGVRDLARAGAPRSNQLSNGFSNLAISGLVATRLADTQCGLRRYPIAATLGLGGREPRYGYEAEILIRAVIAGVRIVEVPIGALYPPGNARVTHFDPWRESPRIVRRVLATVLELRARTLLSRVFGERPRGGALGDGV